MISRPASIRSETAPRQERGRRRRVRWLGVAVAACWFPLWWRISPAWAANPEQAFGWAVPPLAIYLGWQRARNDAVIGTPLAGSTRLLAGAGLCVGLLLGALALPVLESNPLWPTAQWLGAIGAAGATMALLALGGGLAWMRRFAFPVGFIFTALTWPTFLQNGIVHLFSDANAWLAAEVVSWSGLPAMARGNVIEVGTGLVGVDEACSGLRSLQAVWMLGWFFGELYRFSWPRRFALVGAAVTAAFLGNLGRTIFLTVQIAYGGAAAGDRWHDMAGVSVLIVTLVIVAGLAFWWSGRSAEKRALAVDTRPVAPVAPMEAAYGFTGVAAMGAVLVMVIAEAGTQAWFRWRGDEQGRIQWELRRADPAFRQVSAPGRARDLLRYTSEEGLVWTDLGLGVEALAFVFRWEGDTALIGAAELHDPTVCLPGAGARFDADLGATEIVVDGTTIPFATYRFAADGGVQHVFFCHWDAHLGRAYQTTGPMESVARMRLARVGEGRRRGDVAHVTFVVQGLADDAAAVVWAREAVPRLLRRKD